MAFPTVDTIQRFALPPEARLVAGAGGLRRTVSWPVTLRTRAPGFPSLKGGEFLLISTANLSLLDSSLSITRLLSRVAQLGVGGAGVFGEIPDECLTWADEANFPLFSLPADPHRLDLESIIARVVAESRADFHQRIHILYRQLTELAIEGRGLPAIVDELQRVTGKSAFLVDRNLSILTEAQSSAETQDSSQLPRLIETVEAWTKRVPITPSEPPTEYFAIDDATGVLIAPIMTRAGIDAYVGVWTIDQQTDEIDNATVSAAAAAAAIETARDRAVVAAEERAQVSIIEELLIGASLSTESLRSRAARLQIDLEAEHAVLAIAAGAGMPAVAVAEVVQRECRRTFNGAPIGVIGDRAILVSERSDGRIGEAAEQLRQVINRRFSDTAVSIGVGGQLAGADGLRRSYRQAVDALRLGREIFGTGRTTLYSDLGLYRLLLSIRENPELDEFYQDTMGKLATYDAKSDGELLRTLEAYFSSHGSPTEAAERLHVHRNTLLYRLQRVRSIAGIDLEDPEVRLSLQLALRVRRIREAVRDSV